MSTPRYDDFDFDKPVEEWTAEEKAALMEAVAEIDDDLAAVLQGQPSEDGGSAA